jgi:xanthine dehydrogenase accessory factor
VPDIFEEVARIRRERLSATLATVVGGEAGVPGKTGFRMIVYPDGKILGTVGGGLVEAKVREEALRCLQEGRSRLLELELTQATSGIGVLCGGKVKVFVEPIIPLSGVYIFGGGHIALHLAQFAKALDFLVFVVDDRDEFASRERFPTADEVKSGDYSTIIKSLQFHGDDCAVIVTHGHEHDEIVLKECLLTKNRPGYIGMIGSKSKIATVFSHLKQQGASDELLAKVHAPIGLDIGAKTPGEIALSIMAEIIAHKYGKLVEKEVTGVSL